jgi:interferon-induced GTP-binding protein Mx1
MEDTFSKNVRPVLDLVDKLREIGISKDISLPQIAVMGDQSSGKSSVLQSISGIPFPRGSGLVTRCPLELIMKKTINSDWKAEISVRWDLPSQPEESGTVTNIDDLLTRIRALSDILANAGENGFSSDSIVIKVYSPDCPDLTVIDLPGIVRTSTAGQNVSVISQVNNLIDYYISQPNTIILAVVPSNQDIATVDILERALKIDTQGIRTIGVLTKPDLIGPGNEKEVLQVLLNKRKPLQLGYTMVKNYSQKQLNDGHSLNLSHAKEDEKEFFIKHSFFNTYLDKNLFGIDNLIDKLTHLLITHIKRSLPTMIHDIRTLLLSFRSELSSLGDELPSDITDISSMLSKKIASFNQVVRLSSKGEYRDKKGILSLSNDLRFYGQISQYFKTLQDKILVLRPNPSPSSSSSLVTSVNNSVPNGHEANGHSLTNGHVVVPTSSPNANPDNDLIHRLLDEEMALQRGRELPGFLSAQVFSTCMVHLIEEWRYSVDECASNVISSASHVIANLSNVIFKEYPALNSSIATIIHGLVDTTGCQLRESLENLIVVEQEPFTTQEVLLEVVNSIRFRTFDTILRQMIDSINIEEMQENRYLVEDELKKKLGKSLCACYLLCNLSSLLLFSSFYCR